MATPNSHSPDAARLAEIAARWSGDDDAIQAKAYELGLAVVPDVRYLVARIAALEAERDRYYNLTVQAANAAVDLQEQLEQCEQALHDKH